MPLIKLSKEFNRLYTGLINLDINAKKEQNPYKESISMVYNTNSKDIEKLKRNMNTIYIVVNKYENLRKNYLK
ncbi:MAG: hypothetical protein BJBARM5_0626 [Candidatus Parvarchaeum acidophilus ARMAN-5]|jgi:hypothetical protein|uniref:Uncharacterized protein n=1 Tax=Candidatus Parvarchaeum acidophilus ARMAN-5 TaxID=662762 RepID=D6GVV7_PARA5|nr:MAG: hypothetical protein BJBARM5_0626 [Candidatus Parvarchaeum acidophilus ARMAN-5]